MEEKQQGAAGVRRFEPAEIMKTLVPAVGKGKSLKAHAATVSKKA